MEAKSAAEIRALEEPTRRAFQLMTICTFILARTPTVLGYAQHNDLLSRLSDNTRQLGTETEEIANSQEWEEIKKILKI